jgi:hypothetical protein
VGLNLSNLPDKGHYSFKEIADRWECDKSTLNHYIYDLEILRVAVQASSIKSIHLLLYGFSVPGAAEAILGALTRNDQGYLEASNETMPIDPRFIFIDEKDSPKIINYFHNDKEFPDYFYLIPGFVFSEKELEVGDSEDGITVFIETFKGARAYIVDSYSYNELEPNEDVGGYIMDSSCYNELENKMERECSNICFNAIYQNRFTIITKEERDRFENKYGITSETESVQKEISLNVIKGDLPNIANGTIQASRELVLKGWLAGRGIDFGAGVDLTRAQVWRELSKASPELFRPLGKDAINDFFGLQKLCSFRRGRPKEGN